MRARFRGTPGTPIANAYLLRMGPLKEWRRGPTDGPGNNPTPGAEVDSNAGRGWAALTAGMQPRTFWG